MRRAPMFAAGTALILGLTACTGGNTMTVPDLNTTPNTEALKPSNSVDVDDDSDVVKINPDGTFAENGDEASTWDKDDPKFGTPQFSQDFADKAVERSRLETRYGPASPGAFTPEEWGRTLSQFSKLPGSVPSSVGAADGNAIFAIAQLATTGWRSRNAVNAPTSAIPRLAVEPVSVLSTQEGQRSLRSQGQSVASEVSSKGAQGNLSDRTAGLWRLMPVGWCNPANFTAPGECVLPSNKVSVVPESIVTMRGDGGVLGARLAMTTYFEAVSDKQDINVGVRAVYKFWRNPDGESAATWSFDGVDVSGWSQKTTRSEFPEPEATVRPAAILPRIVFASNEAEDSGGGNFPGGSECFISCGGTPTPGNPGPPSSDDGSGGPPFVVSCPTDTTWIAGTLTSAQRAVTYFDPVSGRNWPLYLGINEEYSWALVVAVDSPASCLQINTGNTRLIPNTSWPQRMPPIICPTSYSAALRGPYNRQMQETENFQIFRAGTGGQSITTEFGEDPRGNWRLCLGGTTVSVNYSDTPKHNGRYLGDINIKTRSIDYYYVPNISFIFGNQAGTYQLSRVGAEQDYLERNKRWVMNCMRSLQERTSSNWGDGGSFYDDNIQCPPGTRDMVRYQSDLICPAVSNPFYTPSDSAGVGTSTFQTRGVVDVRANNLGNDVDWRFRQGSAIRSNNPDVRVLGYGWSTMFQFPEGVSGVGENSPSLNPRIWRGSRSDVNSPNQPYRFGEFGDVREGMPLNQNMGPFAEPSSLGVGFRGADTEFLVNGFSAAFADASSAGSYWGVTPMWTVSAVVDALVWQVSGLEIDLVNGRWVITPIFRESRTTTVVNRSCFGEQAKLSAVRVASGQFGADFR